jgi:M6 family metalloprotease-like protein
MKTNKTIEIILFFIFFISGKLSGVPAYPYIIQILQPDGEELSVRMRGDEKMRWMESEDGYSLLYDDDRNIVYAVKDDRGNMVPSSVKARNMALRSDKNREWLSKIPKYLQYSQEQKAILLQTGKIIRESRLRSDDNTSKSALGTAKAVCALIEFPNTTLTYTREDFEQLMNQIGYLNGIQKGSVRDFYLENSYGQLDLIITVVGPYMAQHDYSYYGENRGSMYDYRVEELAKEAANLTFTDPNINPADYDNDGDGYIDTFHFLFAGYGEESGAPANTIWSHKGNFSYPITYGNKKLDTYSCSPELRNNRGTNMTYIGAICHELCHVFGAPDYYDTDNEDNGSFIGTGDWDLMASGSWNNSGATPAHINMYQKIDFGWVKPVELSSPQAIEAMPNSAENPTAYVIRSNNPDEYYILENRQKTGFDEKVPGSGLLIYHVNYKKWDFLMNTVNNRHPQGVYIVAANSGYKTPSGTPASYASINSNTCPFPTTGTAAKTEFTDESTPSAFLWTGGKLGKQVTQITRQDQYISFNFMNPILNLQAEVTGNKICLTWKIPDSAQNIIGYNIYRDGKFILRTNNTVFCENEEKDGTYIYGVGVEFESGESPVEKIEVTVNPTAINRWTPKMPVDIYPNPVMAGEPFYLNLKEKDSNTELFLYTLEGQLVLQKQIDPQQNLHTVYLHTGFYILKIKQSRNVSTLRLVIK